MLGLRLAVVDAAAAPRTFDHSGGPEVLRVTGASLGRELGADAARPSLALDCDGLVGDGLAAFVEGLLLGSYRPNRTGRGSRRTIRRVDVVGVADADALAVGQRRAEATAWARDLANTPASVKTPAWLASQAAAELSAAGVSVATHDAAWLASEGFGGVLSVGAGSVSPPCLVHAQWRPRNARPGTHVVIVGKGITFDTGGLNIKPGGAMRSMHTDMAGGAAALAALRAVALQRVPVRTTVLVPCAENSFGGGSFRPGDVVRHVGGRTSEIDNTDAEGRLVLADAMAYAVRRLSPTVLVDIATLTGAMKVALGLRTGGMFATTDRLAAQLSAAGAATGEPLWRMPLEHDYDDTLASSIADATNAPGNPGGITAALFLEPFAGDVPWAHLDIAGPARSTKDQGVFSRGATGFGARLLTQWVESLA